MSDELLTASATVLAQMIRERMVSSREVAEAHLRRIADVNPRINAVVQSNPDMAMAAAAAADEALACGAAVGPLHGVPFTVKDWIETSDYICTGGFEERREFVPKRDATVVSRMRAAGAILLGKTNVVDGAGIYPRPNNPYDLTRTPGASSSGEAAIVAAGGSPLGLGSDSGGSIRWPAHCCGVAALKPTNRLVPNTGHFPRIGELSDPRTVIGPFARHIEDLALALRVIAGPDGYDPGVVPVPISDPATVEIRGLRVGFFTAMPGADPTPAVIAATNSAVDALADAGALVAEATPPRLDESMPITRDYWSRPESISFAEWTPPRRSPLSGDDVERHIFEWERFRRDMLRVIEAYDVIVCPAAEGAAPPHGPIDTQIYTYTLPFSLTGWPVAVVRAGTSADGMPLAVQVAAQPWHDHVALACAVTMEAALGGWKMAMAGG